MLIGDARAQLQAAEQQYDGVREKVQSLDVEIRYKTEAATALQQEFNGKRVELTRLAQSQSEISACEGDYEVAQRNYDSFAASYDTKTNQLKAQIKVCFDDSVCCLLLVVVVVVLLLLLSVYQLLLVLI